MNKYFPPASLSDNNTLAYLKIRQKLLNFPYEKLLKLKTIIEKDNSGTFLRGLLERIMYEDQVNNMLSFTEDIIVDNQPLLTEVPFYENLRNGSSIINLKPYSERLYFYNLKLEYKKNKLIKNDDSLWINPQSIRGAKLLKSTEAVASLGLENLSKLAAESFSYKLKADNQSDFFFFLRQWFKGYEEGQVHPELYNNSIIIRNEYRIFCLDVSSGIEKWSFGDLGNSGQEYYQTLRHPHQNSFGYEFLLEDDTIFTELDHKFIAVKVENNLNPKLIWERDLGEYTICAKPVKSGGSIIVGLINARMELWVCGFNPQNGKLNWSSYIGTSSFLSPACSISLSSRGKVYIGTNHGVLICLNPSNGEILWLRKYAPKKYGIFDYVLKKQYEDSLLDKGFLPYDTQFMDLDKEGNICYKPRESDYFYILNPRNGRIKKEILIDPRSFYLLRMCQDKLIFLRKNTDTSELTELKVIESGSGRQVYTKVINGGNLKGVYYINNEILAFKVDDKVYFLNIAGDSVTLTDITVYSEGWLLYADNKHLLLEDKFLLSCFNIDNKLIKEQKKHDGSAIESNTKSLMSNFDNACGLDVGSKQSEESRGKILNQIYGNPASLEEILPIIISRLELLRQPAWEGFFIRLEELCGNQTVSFNGVEIKFSNFLRETLLIHKVSEKKENQSVKKEAVHKSYHAEGEKIEILPIKVIKGQLPLGFFLILNFDQLLCVNESGEVIWDRKVFYNNREYSYNDVVEHDTDVNKGRIFAGDIEAFLFDSALIVNDKINIIAVNVNDGSYIWSMTNDKAPLEKEKLKFKQSGSFFKKYGFQTSYLKNVMFKVGFLDGDICVSHGNKVYSIKPLSGFCNTTIDLNVEAILQLYVWGKSIYLLPTTLDKVIVLNKNMEIEKSFDLGFLRDEEKYAELNFVPGSILLKTNSRVIMISEDGNKKGEIKTNDDKRFYMEKFENNLFIISPFFKIICYNAVNNHFDKKWEFTADSSGPDEVWKEFSKKTKFYYIIGGKIIFIYKRNPNYFIAELDLKTGRKEWESLLEKTEGLFYNLSDYQIINNAMSFIMTTTCEECRSKNNEFFDYAKSSILNSSLFQVNFLNGEVIRRQKLQGMMSHDFGDVASARTNNHYIYEVYSKFLNAEVIN